MRKRRARLAFYRRVRNALLATNKRTDNSIITECNIVMPLANDKGIVAPSKGGYSRGRSIIKNKFNKRGRQRNY